MLGCQQDGSPTYAICPVLNRILNYDFNYFRDFCSQKIILKGDFQIVHDLGSVRLGQVLRRQHRGLILNSVED